MKKKQLLVPLFLAVTVLLSVVLQSAHTYEHFVKQFSQLECHHKYKGSTAEITHQHHNFEDCKVCQFTFGSYNSVKEFDYILLKNLNSFQYFIEDSDAVIAFSGSLYAHRGPPINIKGCAS